MSEPQEDRPTSIEQPPAAQPAGDRLLAGNSELSIEDAVAEITARQRVLDGEVAAQASVDTPQPAAAAVAVPISAAVFAPIPAPIDAPITATAAAPIPEPAPITVPSTAPAAAPDLSGLERQLRQITTRIEALRPPSDIEKAIAAVRADLTEISRQLTEALPHRAVESLEIEVRALAERIDHSRQSGVDSTALAGLERGLAEVREALRGLTTAESLVGFDEAVNALAQKVDLVIAKEDPAALQQLEAAIGALRGIVSHVASNDALTRVAEDVRSLAAKVDGLADSAASGRDLSALESRIDKLAAALTASTEAGHAVPRELEKLLAGLIEKLEWVQLTHTDHAALSHLEDRIATLVKRFDASDARLGHLEAIERGLADLLLHIEQMRGMNGRTEDGSRLTPPAMDAIERDIAEIKQSERHTRDSLEAVQGTVEHVVGRLATIESEVHRDAAAGAAPAAQPSATAPEPASASAQSASAREPTLAADPAGTPTPASASAEPAAPAAPRAAAARQPIDPSLPPNHPLEPGFAAGRSRSGASAADRIAASEVAIGSAKPPVIPDAGRPDFIAAARRAAQTAAWGQPGQQRSGEAAPGRDAKPSKLSPRLRKLIVAGGAALIVVGCLHIAARLFDDRSSGAPSQPQSAKALPPAGSMPAANPPEQAPPEAAPRPAPSPTPPVPPSAAPAARKAAKPGRQSLLHDGVAETVMAVVTPPNENKPTAAAMPVWISPDVTGALPRPAGTRSTAPASGRPAAVIDDKLPATIGGPELRAAAMAGDAAAAYEVGTRFAEGRGVAQNSKEAARWLQRAAAQGLAPAQLRLGGLYEKGIGVKKDLAAARDLYLAAAEKGNGKAMHNLAVLYAEGVNGPPDYRSAASWFRKAADHGVTDSQYNLGILYARGIGVAQNYAKSYKWFMLAAHQGDKAAAKKADEVASHLDQQSVTAARLAVQTWSPEPQPAEAISVNAAAAWDSAANGRHAAQSKPRAAGAKHN
jgi:localization factor PodJL